MRRSPVSCIRGVSGDGATAVSIGVSVALNEIGWDGSTRDANEVQAHSEFR